MGNSALSPLSVPEVHFYLPDLVLQFQAAQLGASACAPRASADGSAGAFRLPLFVRLP